MAYKRMGYIGKSFTMGALGLLGTLVACGGGGITGTVAQSVPSGYVLLASSYTPNAAAAGDLKWSTAEGGDVFMGSGGSFVYGDYGLFAQSDIDYYQSVGIQFKHVAALGADAYIYTKVQTPMNASMDVSQSANLMIQMGNGVDLGVQTNSATVFTVELNGGAYNTGTYSYAHACSVNVPLNTTPTANGLRVYKLPLSTFTTCSAGTLAALKSDLKAVLVKVLPSANSTLSNTSTSANFVLPKVGMVAFNK